MSRPNGHPASSNGAAPHSHRGGGAGGGADQSAAAHEAGLLIERLADVDVPSDLLREVLLTHARLTDRISADEFSAIVFARVVDMGLSGNPADVALAARLRILSLACVVRDHFLDMWVKEEDESGIVLFHNTLFVAAAAEPLILLPHDEIGFDPESLRQRVLALATAKGSA